MKKILILLLIIKSFLFSQLLHPENGAYETTVHILFEWKQIPSANAYNLQVYSNNNGEINEFINVQEQSTVYIDTQNLEWNETYYWKVQPVYNTDIGNWSEPSSFTIGQQRLVNLDLDTFNPDLVQDGVIVYSQFQPYFIVGAIDKYGREVWNTDSAYMNHIDEFGQMYGIVNDGNISSGVKFNFHNDYLWQSPDGYNIDGHEVKQIPNGNYMAFQFITQPGPIPPGDWSFVFQGQGYSVDGVTNEFPYLGLKIVEFDKDTNQEVWSWDPFEYFSMFDHDLYEGTWWAAAFNGFYDWMHSNAFHFDEVESVIYVSHRHLSRISKIAYPSGDVIWNMGLPNQYNTGNNNICTELLFSFQHHIQLMDNGDLLFFDNGNLSDMLLGDSNPTTRIRRVKVINDNYCETIWQYDLPQNLHGLGMGSVQLLENDNYSIYTFGSGLSDGECSIIEINQNGDMLWKATSQNQDAAWYRSYKIPSIYPDAFSVIADNFILSTSDNNSAISLEIIETSNGGIKFNIHNKSGYTQSYKYILLDLLDGGPQMFMYKEDLVTLGPNEDVDLIFPIDNSDVLSTTISMQVWPIYHDYASKELMFNVVQGDFLIGDINSDGDVNVVDVVQLVNIVINNSYSPSADLNNDQVANILDIVDLINIILAD